MGTQRKDINWYVGSDLEQNRTSAKAEWKKLKNVKDANRRLLSRVSKMHGNGSSNGSTLVLPINRPPPRRPVAQLSITGEEEELVMKNSESIPAIPAIPTVSTVSTVSTVVAGKKKKKKRKRNKKKPITSVIVSTPSIGVGSVGSMDHIMSKKAINAQKEVALEDALYGDDNENIEANDGITDPYLQLAKEKLNKMGLRFYVQMNKKITKSKKGLTKKILQGLLRKVVGQEPTEKQMILLFLDTGSNSMESMQMHVFLKWFGLELPKQRDPFVEEAKQKMLSFYGTAPKFFQKLNKRIQTKKQHGLSKKEFKKLLKRVMGVTPTEKQTIAIYLEAGCLKDVNVMTIESLYKWCGVDEFEEKNKNNKNKHKKNKKINTKTVVVP